MTDIVLLRLAADACRMNYSANWNPLEDDGYAFRLAVQLGIIVCVDYELGICGIHLPGCRGKYDLGEQLGVDPYAATRRAIVRAAAEIGRRTVSND